MGNTSRRIFLTGDEDLLGSPIPVAVPVRGILKPSYYSFATFVVQFPPFLVWYPGKRFATEDVELSKTFVSLSVSIQQESRVPLVRCWATIQQVRTVSADSNHKLFGMLKSMSIVG